MVKMDKKLIEEYMKYLGNVEEPIRQIVQGIWGLDFVLDTGMSCCGHLLATNNSLSMKGKFRTIKIDGKINNFYIHRPYLHINYSLDENILVKRDAFREDLKSILVKKDNLKFNFSTGCCVKDYATSYGDGIVNLAESYEVLAFVSLEQNGLDLALDDVIKVESLLVDFWERVSSVVKKYNSSALIEPINGKDFRCVKNGIEFKQIMRNKA